MGYKKYAATPAHMGFDTAQDCTRASAWSFANPLASTSELCRMDLSHGKAAADLGYPGRLARKAKPQPIFIIYLGWSFGATPIWKTAPAGNFLENAGNEGNSQLPMCNFNPNTSHPFLVFATPGRDQKTIHATRPTPKLNVTF